MKIHARLLLLCSESELSPSSYLVVLGFQCREPILHLNESRLHLVSYQDLRVDGRHFVAFVRFEFDSLRHAEDGTVELEVLLLIGHGVQVADGSIQRLNGATGANENE